MGRIRDVFTRDISKCTMFTKMKVLNPISLARGERDTRFFKGEIRLREKKSCTELPD